MPTSTERTLSHYALVSYTDAYWALSPSERAATNSEWLGALKRAARQVDIYQVFPAEHAADVCVWSAVDAIEPDATKRFFEAFAHACRPHRRLIRVVDTLWGYTRPSQYSRASRSAQEIDPFTSDRRTYLVIYPFVKTSEWYLLSREERQRLMNEHIRIGKQYPEISQLLLYSFGVQDQEFVVVYEMEDLPRFSELVHELRATEGRPFTLRDTPLHCGIWRPARDTLALFE